MFGPVWKYFFEKWSFFEIFEILLQRLPQNPLIIAFLGQALASTNGGGTLAETFVNILPLKAL